jgi:hypothetical protein
MPGTKALRFWLNLGIMLLWVSLVSQLGHERLLPQRRSPADALHPLQRTYPLHTGLVMAVESLVAQGPHPRRLTKKGAPPMTEQNQARDLLATLRVALAQLEGTLGLAREAVEEVTSQAERVRESVEALQELRPRDDTLVGVEMLLDAAVDFVEAFQELDSGILDAQAEVDTLEAEIVDNEESRNA